MSKRLSLIESQYLLQDGVLHHVEEDSTLHVIPPSESRKKLFTEAHGGRFGAHLGKVKVHTELKRHYWWRGMRSDITKWSRGCTVCTTHGPGQAVKPVLTPIPVARPFDRVGIDVIQFPLSRNGNRYAVVVVDYLTKWPEVFAIPDQSAFTIAKLIVEEVVSRHRVPSEILSDRGRSFLSGLMVEVEKLLGFKKVNTTAYHPHTDGLVERYNRTLKAMLAKTVTEGGKDWDEKILYVLFAYRASMQHSTQESPFFLLYGRDPRLPTEAVLSPPTTRSLMALREYRAGLHSRMSNAWELARGMVKKAQSRQKQQYDRRCRPPNFAEGDKVFLLKPAEQTGELQKLARPYHGPYRIITMDTNTASIRRVDRPEDSPVLVALNCLRRCLDEVGDTFWPPDKKVAKSKPRSAKYHASSKVPPSQETTASGSRQLEGLDPKMDRHQQKGDESCRTAVVKTPTPPTKWEGHLRSRAKHRSVGTSEARVGEM